MSSKKINEMSTSAAVNGAMVFKPMSKSRRTDGKKTKQAGKYAKLTTSGPKSERALREAIRNLIFLNRVKYHEEQAKKEIQEQKVRKIIRFLLKEADNTRDINFTTTGAASAWTFITQIEKTTFENDFANTLKTTKEQREAFKTVYLTGLKIYLDALDQQYLILNPEDQPNMPASAPVAPQQTQQNATENPETPDLNTKETPPAKRRSIREADEGIHPTAAQALPSQNEPLDTSRIQSAAVSSALTSTQKSQLDKTGRNAAESALKRDLPQIDPLYFNLTFKNVTLQTGRNTNDRQEFRFFLIGDQNKAGNIQIKFKEWEDKMPIGGQESGNNTPKMEPNPLNLPDISSGGGADATAAAIPPAGGAELPALPTA